MKTCKKCNASKNDIDFNKRSRSKDGIDTICKECHNIRKRLWCGTPQGKEAYKKGRIRANNNKTKAVLYLGGVCKNCGGIYDNVCYDIHHIDSIEKEANPTILRNYSWENYRKELDKCILLCANCHRVVHKVL